MEYSWDFKIVLDSLPVLLRGLVVTVELWTLAFVFGFTLGLVVSLGRVSGRAWVNGPTIAYVELFRNTPVLVQLIWFYYAFPIVLGQQLSPLTAAALALTLNTSAYCAEIFRGGIVAIGRGQWEGAKAIGMTRAMTMQRVILPQVLKSMLPAFTNRAIELAKVTSLASLLAVNEIMYQGRLLSSTYYRPLEILTVVAVFYFLLIYPGSYLSARLERRLAARD
ncbi:MAG TPA: amino acid ABC transporter permease [Casimicrobiaceae bacterium]|jgi:polar amino acid transport system permease protein|nr:amino acid ABC transporter permease [Casimicrobiaceae bacterium]